MAQWLGGLAVLPEGLDLVPCTHTAACCCLCLLFQIPGNLMPSYRHTYRQNANVHIKINNFLKIKYINTPPPPHTQELN